MNCETVLDEWNSLTYMMSDLDQTQTAGPKVILNIIRQLKPTAGDVCPTKRLCCIAATLPLSTALVERVFSDVRKAISDLRTRLKLENTHKL